MNKCALIVFKGAYDSLCIFIYSIGLYIFSSDAWLHPPFFVSPFSFTTNWYLNLFTDEKHALHMVHIYVCEKIDLIDFFKAKATKGMTNCIKIGI
jgi:hypothetical protein